MKLPPNVSLTWRSALAQLGVVLSAQPSAGGPHGAPLDAEAEEQHLRHQLSQARQRLLAHYQGRADLSDDSVRRTFERVAQRYADAHIRAFVPILVERAARGELDRSAPPGQHS